MTNKDLLKEAIADAKAVKETAIANAKLALEEAFTPHLKSMLSAKLQEMDKEEEVKEEEELDEMDAVSFRRKNSPSYNMDPDGGPVNPVPHKVGKSTVQEDEVDEEVKLDELINELTEDARTDAEQEGYEDGFEDAKEDVEDALKKMKVSEDERTDAEEEGYKDGMKDEKEDMEDDMEDKEIDLEEMSEDDLKSFIEDVISDMVAAGEIEAGDEFVEDKVEVEDEVEVEDVEDVDVDDDVDVEIEIDEEMKSKEDEKVDEMYSKKKRYYEEMKKSKKEDMDEEMMHSKKKKEDMDEMAHSKKEKEDMDEEMMHSKKKKEDMDEMEMSDPVMRHGEKGDDEIEKETEKMRFKEVMSEIEALKSELQEVNLLNAKLLYTNKIFREKNLTESKKVKVLKAFDNAKDVNGAKTIFETLNEGILDAPVVKSYKRGSASKATGLEPKTEKQPIIESNDAYNRMRKLAGLI